MEKKPFDPSDSEKLQDDSAVETEDTAAESMPSNNDSSASAHRLRRTEKHAKKDEETVNEEDSSSSDKTDVSDLSEQEETNDLEDGTDQDLADDREEQSEPSYLPAVIESDEIADEILTELDQKRKEANKVVLAFTATAAATGALPIPLADAPLLIAQQVAMIAKLSDIYQINLKKSGLKSLVFTVLGVSGTTVLGKTITGSLFKAIPGIGAIGGAALFGTTAAALTAALGAAYGEVCEKVFLGDLDESRLLEYEGRHLLETSFKNHLQIELDSRKQQEKDDDDVLRQTSIPNDEDPIVLQNTADQADSSQKDQTGSSDLNPPRNTDESQS